MRRIPTIFEEKDLIFPKMLLNREQISRIKKAKSFKGPAHKKKKNRKKSHSPRRIRDKETIYILSTGYNCARFVREYYRSLRLQSYENWIVYIMDDASTDNTARLLSQINDPRLKIFRNPVNMGAAYSRIALLKKMDAKNNPVLQIDLDDYLHGTSVFSKIHNIYKDPSIMMTFSSYKIGSTVYKNNFYSKAEIDNHRIVTDRFLCSPLRSFRFNLSRNLTLDDMKDSSGRYYRYCTDVALFLPLLKQIKYNNVHLFNDVMYAYRSRGDSISRKFNRPERLSLFKTLVKKFNS